MPMYTKKILIKGNLNCVKQQNLRTPPQNNILNPKN